WQRGVLPLALLALCVITLIGCASCLRRPAVPQEHENLAAVPGVDGLRWWGDVGDDPTFLTAFIESIRHERDYRASHGQPGLAPSIAYLAVSGGGSDGAFG